MMNFQDSLTGNLNFEIESAELSDEPELKVVYGADGEILGYFDGRDALIEEEEEYEPHGFMAPKHKEYLQQWLADKRNWERLRILGQDFQDGARLVTIEGDGNCFFSSVSTALTYCKEKPNGTPDRHNELRQSCCDWIEKNKDS